MSVLRAVAAVALTAMAFAPVLVLCLLGGPE